MDPVTGTPPKKSMSAGMMVLIGCGALVGILGLVIIGGIVWLFSGPEGGVKLANQMDHYALKHLADHHVLHDGEKVVAYFDETMRMDGSEAALLTGDRLVYIKDNQVTGDVKLADVSDIEYAHATLGDTIVVTSSDGTTLQIEVAPFNNGDTFNKALRNAANAKQPNHNW